MAPSKHLLKPSDIEQFFYHDNFAGSNVAEDGANVFMSFSQIEQNFLNFGLEGFCQNKNLEQDGLEGSYKNCRIRNLSGIIVISASLIRKESNNLSELEKTITSTKSASEQQKVTCKKFNCRMIIKKI